MPTVVSLGLSCMARYMIGRAGFDGPRYPFDDIFTCLPIVNDCLEDDFAEFLNFDRLLPGEHPQAWVQSGYLKRYGQTATIAHHDMNIAANRASFERKVWRFRGLRFHREPIAFVAIGPDHAFPAEQVLRLHRNLCKTFVVPKLMIIAIGDRPALVPCVTALNIQPSVPTETGLDFPHPADNAAVIAMIRDFATLRHAYTA